MTITTSPKSKSKARKLSDKDRMKGVEILNSLQTVERAKRLNDHFPEVVKNIFTNEMVQPDLVKYLRRVAGFEVPAQKALVQDLLVTCYESSS